MNWGLRKLVPGWLIWGVFGVWLSAWSLYAQQSVAQVEETADQPSQQIDEEAAAEKLPTVLLARDGKPQFPIWMAEGASRQVREAVLEMQRILLEMTGAKFEIKTFPADASPSGIRVATLAEVKRHPLFAKQQVLEPVQEFDPADLFRREEYLIVTDENGVWLVGATPLALQHAVWDLLEGLGYRQYFPGKLWEVIPKRSEIVLARNEVVRPDYHARRIWYSTAKGWDDHLPEFQDWMRKNRLGDGFRWATGQAYPRIIQSNKAFFEQHPDFYAEVKGERKFRGAATKFNVVSPGLRQFVAEFALQFFEKHPNADSISLEPSHGGGWADDAESRALGRASDQALYLANSVAEQVKQKYADKKYVGIVAYQDHSLAPRKTKVHENVIVSVATSFIRGGLSFEELVASWKKQGMDKWGVRDYFSVNAWDRDLPGRPLSSNLPQLMNRMADYHQLGAILYAAQSGDNWGPNGLPHYLASKVLWDVSQAKRYQAWMEEFVHDCFGVAVEPMRRFYQRIHHIQGRPLLSEDLIGELYRDLQQAHALAKGQAEVLQRIRTLVLYVRYVELYQDYANATGEPRQQAFETLIRYAWSIRPSKMIQVLDLYRDLVRRDKQVAIPKEAEWNIEAKTNSWKQGTYPEDSQIDHWLEQGVKNNQLKGFEIVEFSENLKPAAAALGLSAESYSVLAKPELRLRGNRSFYVWADHENFEFPFEVSVGKPGTADTRIELQLFYCTDNGEQIVDERAVRHKEEVQQITLKSPFEGLHVMRIRDFGASTTLAWKPDLKVTQVETSEMSTTPHGRSSAYFFVPAGTKTIGGFGGGRGRIVDPRGEVRFDFSKDVVGQGYFKVEVPEGMEGKLWSLQDNEGPRMLLTVPSYFVTDPNALLLPAELMNKK